MMEMPLPSRFRFSFVCMPPTEFSLLNTILLCSGSNSIFHCHGLYQIAQYYYITYITYLLLDDSGMFYHVHSFYVRLIHLCFSFNICGHPPPQLKVILLVHEVAPWLHFFDCHIYFISMHVVLLSVATVLLVFYILRSSLFGWYFMKLTFGISSWYMLHLMGIQIIFFITTIVSSLDLLGRWLTICLSVLKNP